MLGQKGGLYAPLSLEISTVLIPRYCRILNFRALVLTREQVTLILYSWSFFCLHKTKKSDPSAFSFRVNSNSVPVSDYKTQQQKTQRNKAALYGNVSLGMLEGHRHRSVLNTEQLYLSIKTWQFVFRLFFMQVRNISSATHTNKTKLTTNYNSTSEVFKVASKTNHWL
jgi:hypothetical protein